MSNIFPGPLRSEESPREVPVIIGRSKAVRDMQDFAKKMAQNNYSILLLGETGVGKGLFARVIHEEGRPRKKFVPVVCGGIPSELIESELFGHHKGAFSGACNSKKGLVEVASFGTFFLDEVEDMSARLQAAILRLLEEKMSRPLGGIQEDPFTARVISASNVDLAQAVKEKQFRPDLFYRLNVVVYTIPPLRDRKEDIPKLAQYFLTCEEGGKKKEFSPGALKALHGYSWPGNIRELRTIVIRVLINSSESEVISQECVEPHLSNIEGS